MTSPCLSLSVMLPFSCGCPGAVPATAGGSGAHTCGEGPHRRPLIHGVLRPQVTPGQMPSEEEDPEEGGPTVSAKIQKVQVFEAGGVQPWAWGGREWETGATGWDPASSRMAAGSTGSGPRPLPPAPDPCPRQRWGLVSGPLTKLTQKGQGSRGFCVDSCCPAIARMSGAAQQQGESVHTVKGRNSSTTAGTGGPTRKGTSSQDLRPRRRGQRRGSRSPTLVNALDSSSQLDNKTVSFLFTFYC